MVKLYTYFASKPPRVGERVLVILTLHRSCYPATSAHPVSVLITHRVVKIKRALHPNRDGLECVFVVLTLHRFSTRRTKHAQCPSSLFIVENTSYECAHSPSVATTGLPFITSGSMTPPYAELPRQGLEAKVRGMRTRCARLARLAGGDPAAVFPDTVPRGMDGTVMEGEKCEEKNDEWAEAGVQEAAAAMAAGRRRALEEEVERLGHAENRRCC